MISTSGADFGMYKQRQTVTSDLRINELSGSVRKSEQDRKMPPKATQENYVYGLNTAHFFLHSLCETSVRLLSKKRNNAMDD